MHINCKLAGSGWVKVKIVAGTNDQFNYIKEYLAKNLVVFKYDKYSKEYLTTLYDFERLDEACGNLKIQMYASEKFVQGIETFNREQHKIEKAKDNKIFKNKYWKPDMPPHEYQCVAINTMVQARRRVLGDDLGVGKTPQGLGVIFGSFEKYGFERAVIMSPVSLMYQWKEEMDKFTNFPQDKVHIIDQHLCKTGERTHFQRECKGVKYKNIPQCPYFEECKKEQDLHSYRLKQIKEATILIINYDKLEKYEKYIIKEDYDIFILDEAKEVKNPRSKKTMSAKKIANHNPANVVITMSATVVENEMKDLYSIMDVTNPLVFDRYTSFRDKFLVVDHYNNVTGVKTIKQDLLKEIVDQHLTRRTLEEVWVEGRPEITQTIRHVTMSKFQQQVYSDAVNQKLTDIEESGKKINQAMMATLIGYLLQICDTTKSIGLEDKNHSCKMEELKNILLNELPTDRPMIVFSRFGNKVVPHIVEELRDLLGKGKVDSITGSTSQKDRNKIKTRFTEGKLKVLVCSDALAYGANLQNCNYMVNYDLPWNPAVLWQRIGRIYRQGQKRNVIVINLFIKDTFEEHLYNLLKSKHELSKIVLKESAMQKSSKTKEIDLTSLMKYI